MWWEAVQRGREAEARQGKDQLRRSHKGRTRQEELKEEKEKSQETSIVKQAKMLLEEGQLSRMTKVGVSNWMDPIGRGAVGDAGQAHPGPVGRGSP